jgi:hypothetical protein
VAVGMIDNIIAETPTDTPGVGYAVSIVDSGPPDPPAKVEWLCLSILIEDKVHRSLLIDPSALKGIISCLDHAARLREKARAESSALLERLKGGQP